MFIVEINTLDGRQPISVAVGDWLNAMRLTNFLEDATEAIQKKQEREEDECSK